MVKAPIVMWIAQLESAPGYTKMWRAEADINFGDDGAKRERYNPFEEESESTFVQIIAFPNHSLFSFLTL